ncbi:MAG: LPS export ABC transporter periplasmic protein LptC [Flavobacteriaceae bacterium]|nr:LPS export ABC transporter periplasmic protein LptC [Flavobacteriaceae bacterium]
MIFKEYPYHRNIVAGFLVAIFFIFQSCEEDLAKVNQSKNKNFPSKTIYNAHIIQKDSGFVKIKFKAPILEEYEFIDTPYVEVKKGLYLEFFDQKKPKTLGTLRANYAKFIEKTDFYEAKGDVKVVNNEGQTFLMQSIYWDRLNRKMYTQDTVFISDKEGNSFVAANGMIAKDDFSEYTFYNNSGEIKDAKTMNK